MHCSKLVHPTAEAPSGFRLLVTPTYRSSTVLSDCQAAAADDWRQSELWPVRDPDNSGAWRAELERALCRVK